MQPRSLALALTVALLALTGPAAAQSASPSPSAEATAAPSTEPSVPPSAEPSASPSDETSPAPQPSTARSLRGTLMSIKGTIATVKLANGQVQTYTVSAKAAAALKKSLGKKLLFRVAHGALDLIPH